MTQAQDNSVQIKQVIRKNLKVLHDFCELHGLTYYLSDGTLLGAIRHKGIIPWDDDADVCMPRPDYERLIRLANKLPPSYKLGHFKLNQEYVHPFIKLMDSRTEIIEHAGKDSYKTAIWVDIFPLDGTYENIKARKLHYFVVKYTRFLYEQKKRKYQPPTDNSSRLKLGLKKILKPIICTCVTLLPKKLLFNLMDLTASHKNFDTSSIVGNLYTTINTKASHKKKWFAERLLTEFDGYSFYSMTGYHEYLTNLYGDYMTPPPKNKRQTHNIEIIKLFNDKQ